MREKYAGNSDEFEKISSNIQSFAPIVYEKDKDINLPFNFKLKSMPSRTIYTFQCLIKVELFENPSIFSLFASSIECFYIENGNEESGVACERLKSKYFHGNYDNNILIKYLIGFYDPQKGWENAFHYLIPFQNV